ncbi:MAG TPA: OmpA family protein [Kofleriaceae bacterium]|nr:OmpA family protein [Kofleriaceae bacterium]
MLHVRVMVCAVMVMAAPVLARGDAGLGQKDPGLFNLKGTIYFLPSTTTHMPDKVESLPPQGTIYAESLDVPPRPFKDGFPGVTDRFEWFGIVYTGRFQVAAAGDFAFRSRTDDGIILWIDGKQILADDSIHGPRDAHGTVRLAKGLHDMKVWYWQGPAVQIALQLFVTPPGGKEAIFSMKDYAADLGRALTALGGEATPDGIRLRLDAKVLFAFDKATLRPAARKVLAQVAAILAPYPNASVSIGGYTSSEGDDAYNLALSQRRADAVRAALAKTVAPTITLTASGHGEADPIADNTTEKTRAPNRRVELLIRP